MQNTSIQVVDIKGDILDHCYFANSFLKTL